MGTILEAARRLAGKVEVDFIDWHEASKDKVRRQVIVADALFESVLDDLIEYKLSPKDEVLDQLLAANRLPDKTRLAYVLGLITRETMQDLQFMHNIRNTFAHECEPDFSDPKCAKHILRLSVVPHKKRQVTALNYMDLYFEAGRKCRDSIFKAIDALRAVAETTAQISGASILNSRPK